MTDYSGNGNKNSGNLFFNWAKPYFDFVGKGKIYSLVYVVMAFLNLIIPVIMIFLLMDSDILRDSGPRVITAFVISWLVLAFACWVGFQLWWTRKLNLRRFESADFIATPVISEILQTTGEWIGTLSGIIGIGVGLTFTIFLWGFPKFYTGFESILFQTVSEIGPYLIIGGPVMGFVIILIFRFIAEQIRIISSIANSTKEIARNLRK